MGTYSIVYVEGSSNYGQSAVDWDWNVKGQWACSEKDGPGGKWITIPGIDEKVCQAILRHFGLEQWVADFPTDRLIVMSPGELAAARRNKESKCDLPKKEMKSDTLGYHIRAEIHT